MISERERNKKVWLVSLVKQHTQNIQSKCQVKEVDTAFDIYDGVVPLTFLSLPKLSFHNF